MISVIRRGGHFMQDELIEIGLNGDSPLKVILKGETTLHNGEKIGVVSLVYATIEKEKARNRLNKFLETATPEQYYMVYSVPLDTDLTKLSHYPSIALTKEDLD